MIDFHKVCIQVLCQIYRCMDFKHFPHFWDRYRYCYCCSGVKSHWTLCDPKSCSTPGSPILHYLPEFAQTHVQWVSDAIQQSHILSPPSPPTLSLSQHQGLFQWVGSSQQMAKELEIQHQHQSFQRISRVAFFSGLTGLILLLSKGLSRVFSRTTIWKHLFFSPQPSLWSYSLYGPNLT